MLCPNFENMSLGSVFEMILYRDAHIRATAISVLCLWYIMARPIPMLLVWADIFATLDFNCISVHRHRVHCKVLNFFDVCVFFAAVMYIWSCLVQHVSDFDTSTAELHILLTLYHFNSRRFLLYSAEVVYDALLINFGIFRYSITKGSSYVHRVSQDSNKGKKIQ